MIRRLTPQASLWIFGVDVSRDLMTYQTTVADGRQPSLLTATLANKNSRYTLTKEEIPYILWKVTEEDAEGIASLEEPSDSAFNAARDYVSATNARNSARANEDQIESNAQGLGMVNNQAGYQEIRQYAARVFDVVAARVAKGIVDPVKRRIIQAKISSLSSLNLVATKTPPAGAAGKGADARTLSNIAALAGIPIPYEFYANAPIFSQSDPIRLFERDGETNIWFYGFSGFASQFSRGVDSSGRNTLSVTCESAERILRYSRLTFNPGIADAAVVSVLTDTIAREFTQDGLQNMALPDYVAALMFGEDVVAKMSVATDAKIAGVSPFVTRRSVNGQTNSPANAAGVGAFNYRDSRAFILGASDAALSTLPSNAPSNIETHGLDSLDTWQRMIDHQVDIKDLEEMIVFERVNELDSWRDRASQRIYDRLTGDVVNSITQEGLINIIGANPHVFPVDHGRLLMLFANSSGVGTSREILLNTIAQGPGFITDWQNKLAIIYDMAERVDHRFYCTPKGDLVFEMPLHDYAPSDFGKRFEPRYTFLDSDMMSVTDSRQEDKIRNIIICYPELAAQNPELGNAEDVADPPQVAYSDSLIAQYGARPEKVPPKHFIDTAEAAQIYACVKLNQINADAMSLDVGVVPRLGIGPNRPVFLDEPYAIATICNVQRTVTGGVSPTYQMKMSLNSARRWHGDVDTTVNRPLFAPIGGFGGKPLNLALFNPQTLAVDSAKALNASQSAPSPVSAPKSSAAAPKDAEAQRLERAKATYAQFKAYVDGTIAATLRRGSTPLGAGAGVPLQYHISSTARSESENAHNHGVKNSTHLDGYAVDFAANKDSSTTNAQIETLLRLLWAEDGAGPIFYILRHDAGSGVHVHVAFKNPEGRR